MIVGLRIGLLREMLTMFEVVYKLILSEESDGANYFLKKKVGQHANQWAKIKKALLFDKQYMYFQLKTNNCYVLGYL